jgi:predicted transcriptional regulator of viral defense system
LPRLVKQGQLQKLERGIYTAETVPASEHISLLEVSRNPKAVICLLSALSFHEIDTPRTEHQRRFFINLPSIDPVLRALAKMRQAGDPPRGEAVA